ncbi:uncharacterized [Lates japonicus]
MCFCMRLIHFKCSTRRHMKVHKHNEGTCRFACRCEESQILQRHHVGFYQLIKTQSITSTQALTLHIHTHTYTHTCLECPTETYSTSLVTNVNQRNVYFTLWYNECH